jgi:hypothetical protein
MSNMDKKQEAFFNLAHGLASAFDRASGVGKVMMEIQDRAEQVLDGKRSPEIFTVPQFAELLDSMSTAQAHIACDIAMVLDLIVRTAEASGVIDSEFAREFRGKFSHALDKPEDKPEGFGGRFSAN